MLSRAQKKCTKPPCNINCEFRPGFSGIAPIVGRTKELMREDRCGVFGGEEGDSCCVLLVVGRETNVPSPNPADHSYTDTLNTYSNLAGFSTLHWTD